MKDSQHLSSHALTVVSGSQIANLMPSLRQDILRLVEETYLQHDAGLTNNPDSYFLKFEERQSDRIIALPAAIANDTPISGIKWIASYPKNIERNLQRASAVLLLNDYETGYPVACLEASQISSARTAASAVVAARTLAADPKKALKITFVGAGVISRAIFDFFMADGWKFDQVTVCDLDAASATELRHHVEAGTGQPAFFVEDLKAAISAADIVVFATNAGTPYVSGDDVFAPGQIILNVSLRDISPDIIWQAFNVFDDVEHCMKANTSPHLAEQKYGDRSFVHGTLAHILNNPSLIDRSRPLIFSPFGLGVLDLVVGQLFVDKCLEAGAYTNIADFIPDTRRWAASHG
ncbi:2,3-diaminopropionate biosynthesis protein SbnB [Pseudomonas sp. TH08]|uniref:2,3-diaminopropionate biosynthesis protein SbnB n=1 Tax=unclassified Pseudomonas TaxID=196821 RepID=UPI001911E87D|nr:MULTISPECIES: 2,3-diaminopropionate biosynthesis protein SbnB [unclassified Pseudomonas]MBK5525748.1 2,3-diaminopropionate biosynthesis protein SbnB [Pseudomonas sp. TH06]MBK5535636.1 2,3-diaminopropionate biosynthesis protein SbnB [Pseudomonas sp. TH08]